MRIIRLLLILLVVMAGVAFALLNAEPVTLNYYIASTELPLALVFTLALMLGALLGALAVLAADLHLRRELLKLRRSQRLHRKEIDNLRALPVKD